MQRMIVDNSGLAQWRVRAPVFRSKPRDILKTTHLQTQVGGFCSLHLKHHFRNVFQDFPYCISKLMRVIMERPNVTSFIYSNSSPMPTPRANKVIFGTFSMQCL